MVEFLRPEHTSDQRTEGTEQPAVGGEVKKQSRIRRILRFPLKSKITDFIGRSRRRKVLFLSLLAMPFVLLLLVVVIPAATVYSQVRSLPAQVGVIRGSVEERDLDKAEAALGELDSSLSRFSRTYNYLSYLKFIPFLGRYYSDGVHLLNAARLAVDSGEMVVASLKPYQEILGLKEGFGDQITVEQRLTNLLGTLPSLSGSLDEVWGNLLLIEAELEEVDPTRYPEEIRGVKVRFWIEEARSILAETGPLLEEGRTILELAPQLLGSPTPRTYLVLFQNDAEIRATGGFITGLSMITLEGGKVVENEFKSGAYVARTTPYIPPPAPLGKYLRVGTWHFQDANYYPDFPASAREVLRVWELSRLPAPAGVVSINTQVASNILEITGPIHIPGYDLDLSKLSFLPESCQAGGREFTTENLVCRLEYYVERNPQEGTATEERKLILGKLSDAVIQKITSATSEIWPRLVDMVFESLEQKNIMIYALEAREQELIKSLGWAGEMRDFEGDYLHISDSNFGGKKTDLFLEEEVEQILERREDGVWQKTVKISYFNPQPLDNWLSSVYKDFVRLYVPSGSRLLSVEGGAQIWTAPDKWATGIENPAGWQEFGKTVFGAYFTLWPQQEHAITFVYELPQGAVGGETYRLLMQKQSGTNIGLVEVKIGGNIEAFELKTDFEVSSTVEQ
ncbi:DUF4012 domain-containing protein [Candidatus Saccharibacteria bacterium]|nr:DUF4012 domain-containing protein [Candidatus Saccharibacteria bacterium]